ncbi:hypothetical protein BH23VER1_BH23VER1_05840 [soil metagenome]
MKSNIESVMSEGASGRAVELQVLCGDGFWRSLPEAWAQPVPEKLVLPEEAIHQLVCQAKGGPVTLETVLDAVRQEWISAA